MNLKFDPSATGLYKVFKDYQVEAMRLIWDIGDEGVTSRIVHREVYEKLAGGKSISRASIINFLNAMVDEGVLDYVEESGKGGYHRVYSPRMYEIDFRKALIKSVIDSLMTDFPQETMETIAHAREQVQR
jgi:predicted transcriptional regulator